MLTQDRNSPDWDVINGHGGIHGTGDDIETTGEGCDI